MAQITYGQFAALVLAGLGAPITENNIDKISAVAAQEGTHGTYNPFNSVAGPGTNYNSVGVKNYPDLGTGVLQTVKLLKQSNTSAMLSNLVSDGPFDQFISATNTFYGSWGGGTINVSQQTAQQAAWGKLLEGDVTQPVLEGVSKAITPNQSVIQQLDALFNGQIYPTGKPPTGLAAVGAAIADPIQSGINAISSVNDVLTKIGSTLFNPTFWKWVGLGALGVMLILIAVSMNKSVQEGAGTVAKGMAA